MQQLPQRGHHRVDPLTRRIQPVDVIGGIDAVDRIEHLLRDDGRTRGPVGVPGEAAFNRCAEGLNFAQQLDSLGTGQLDSCRGLGG